MLDELECPSLEARRDQSSLLLFHKIHCGAVSIEKDKYMTPAHSLKTTRSSHSAQYRRHQTYSDALKNSFSPELFHIGIVYLLLWQMPSPQRSLGHSLFKQKISQKFFVFFFCVFFVFFVFYFIKISKFALPGVMLMYERTSKDRKNRKKESKKVCIRRARKLVSIVQESSYPSCKKVRVRRARKFVSVVHVCYYVTQEPFHGRWNFTLASILS